MEDLERRVRDMTKSLPPSDLNSHRAIMLIVGFVASEIEACAKMVEANTDFMMLQDSGMQTMCTQLRENLAKEIRDRL